MNERDDINKGIGIIRSSERSASRDGLITSSGQKESSLAAAKRSSNAQDVEIHSGSRLSRSKDAQQSKSSSIASPPRKPRKAKTQGKARKGQREGKESFKGTVEQGGLSTRAREQALKGAGGSQGAAGAKVLDSSFPNQLQSAQALKGSSTTSGLPINEASVTKFVDSIFDDNLHSSDAHSVYAAGKNTYKKVSEIHEAHQVKRPSPEIEMPNKDKDPLKSRSKIQRTKSAGSKSARSGTGSNSASSSRLSRGKRAASAQNKQASPIQRLLRLKRFREHSLATKQAGGTIKASASAKSTTTTLKATFAGAGKAAGGSGAGGAIAAAGVTGLIILAIAAVLLVGFFVVGAMTGSIAEAQNEPSIDGLDGYPAIIASFLLDQGLEPLHVAAIMANAHAESGYNPALAEVFNPAEAQEFTSAGQGRGLFQWSFVNHPTGGNRRGQLYNFTGFEGNAEALDGSLSRQNPNGSWANINNQLNFLWGELTGQGPAANYTSNGWGRGGSWSGFLLIDDLEDATYYFAYRFLRPHQSALDARMPQKLEEAERIYAILMPSGDFAGGFVWPTPGFTNITSPFGYRPRVFGSGMEFHTGIDIAQAGINNAPVVAIASGQVTFAGWMGGYGNTVVINHGNGTTSLYAHLSSLGTSPGRIVSAGQRIGSVGSTGNSTGPHLHFEIRVHGQPVDPMGFRVSSD